MTDFLEIKTPGNNVSLGEEDADLEDFNNSGNTTNSILKTVRKVFKKIGFEFK
jgi:hypothetical protein